MPSWNEAPTTPDLMVMLAEAIAANTLEVTGPERPYRTESYRTETRRKRTGREVFDHYLASGMPAAAAVGMTTRYLEAGGDATTYRVRELPGVSRADGRADRPQFVRQTAGWTPAPYNGPSCGRRVSQVTGSDRARRLAEEWREMRR